MFAGKTTINKNSQDKINGSWLMLIWTKIQSLLDFFVYLFIFTIEKNNKEIVKNNGENVMNGSNQN